MATRPKKQPVVPEDVLAEMDVEERRMAAESEELPTADTVPEDVLGELDHEARIAREDARARLVEGRPPADDDEEPRD
jgi:hypothetical protein